MMPRNIKKDRSRLERSSQRCVDNVYEELNETVSSDQNATFSNDIVENAIKRDPEIKNMFLQELPPNCILYIPRCEGDIDQSFTPCTLLPLSQLDSFMKMLDSRKKRSGLPMTTRNTQLGRKVEQINAPPLPKRNDSMRQGPITQHIDAQLATNKGEEGEEEKEWVKKNKDAKEVKEPQIDTHRKSNIKKTISFNESLDGSTTYSKKHARETILEANTKENFPQNNCLREKKASRRKNITQVEDCDMYDCPIQSSAEAANSSHGHSTDKVSQLYNEQASLPLGEVISRLCGDKVSLPCGEPVNLPHNEQQVSLPHGDQQVSLAYGKQVSLPQGEQQVSLLYGEQASLPYGKQVSLPNGEQVSPHGEQASLPYRKQVSLPYGEQVRLHGEQASLPCGEQVSLHGEQASLPYGEQVRLRHCKSQFNLQSTELSNHRRTSLHSQDPVTVSDETRYRELLQAYIQQNNLDDQPLTSPKRRNSPRKSNKPSKITSIFYYLLGINPKSRLHNKSKALLYEEGDADPVMVVRQAQQGPNQ